MICDHESVRCGTTVCEAAVVVGHHICTWKVSHFEYDNHRIVLTIRVYYQTNSRK